MYWRAGTSPIGTCFDRGGDLAWGYDSVRGCKERASSIGAVPATSSRNGAGDLFRYFRTAARVSSDVQLLMPFERSGYPVTKASTARSWKDRSAILTAQRLSLTDKGPRYSQSTRKTTLLLPISPFSPKRCSIDHDRGSSCHSCIGYPEGKSRQFKARYEVICQQAPFRR